MVEPQWMPAFTPRSISRPGSTEQLVGGADGDNGVVYRLVREGNGWVFSPIYTFRGHEGCISYARVVFGQDGLLMQNN